MLRLIHSPSVLTWIMDVTEFRFEMGVEHDVVKTKHVVVQF